MIRAANALVLALVYLAMVGSVTARDAAVALVVGASASLTASRGSRVPARRLLAVPWFVLGALIAIARGGARMLPVLLRRGRAPRLGSVEVPWGERSSRSAAVGALVASATPGTVLVRFDERRRTLVLNVIDASDPEAIRTEFETFYRRYQRHVLP